MAAVFRVVEIVGAILAVVYLFVTVWTLLRGRRRYLPLVTLLLLPSLAEATTLTVAACNGTNDHLKVQTQVDAAVNGDVVQIPAGTCTFASAVSWTNKAITVQGAGVDSTLVNHTSEAFAITATTTAGFRIASMKLRSSTASSYINVDGSGAASAVPGRFRVDHVYFDMTGGNSPRAYFAFGIVYGLMDHCTFVAGSSVSIPVFVEPAMISAGDGANPYGYTSWNLPLDLGGDTAVYVEDSTFTTAVYGGHNDSTYGGRMVLRHNTFTGPAHTQTHATRGGEFGGMKLEIYNNVFDGQNDPGYPGANFMLSGTGVVFNNTILNNEGGGNWPHLGLVLYMQRCPDGDCVVNSAPLGLCSTGSGYDGGVEANGWPCLGQPGEMGGLGSAFTNVPVYAWMNGPEAGCATGGSCSGSYGVDLNCGGSMGNYIKTTAHSNGDKDYCVGTTSMPSSCGNHTNTYTAYTYPHPLQGAAPSTYAFFLQSWPLVAESLSLLGVLVHCRRVLLAGLMAGVTLGTVSVGYAKQLTQATGTVVHTAATKAAIVYLNWSNRRDH